MTPSEIIDPVGARPRVAPHTRAPEKRSWASRHRIVGALLILIVGFGFMQLLFVGGPQRAPLLPVAASSPGMSVAAGTDQTPPSGAKRAHTQPNDVMTTGTIGAPLGASAGHPLPPQRPNGI
jgi:hypothetical protein